MYHDIGPTPFFRNNTMLGQFKLNFFKICTWFIHFVNSDYNLGVSCLCMIDSLDCLWHNAVICCNNKDCNISNLGSTCTHSRESFVTGSIKECYLASALKTNGIGANMLCNTAGFTFNNGC